jgi:hypothetical protein
MQAASRWRSNRRLALVLQRPDTPDDAQQTNCNATKRSLKNTHCDSPVEARVEACTRHFSHCMKHINHQPTALQSAASFLLSGHARKETTRAPKNLSKARTYASRRNSRGQGSCDARVADETALVQGSLAFSTSASGDRCGRFAVSFGVAKAQ